MCIHTLALWQSPEALDTSSKGTAPCSLASLKISLTILLEGILSDDSTILYSVSPE